MIACIPPIESPTIPEQKKKKSPTMIAPASCLIITPCLDSKILQKKTSHRIFGHTHEVLNKIYLQNFLRGWVVNREMNLTSLFNS